MMMFGGSDKSVKQVYFMAYRDVVYKAKKQRQGTSMVERFTRSMGQYMLKETFDSWVRGVAESKRERSAAERREGSKQYLLKMVAQSDEVLVRTCFMALRDLWIDETKARLHKQSVEMQEILAQREVQMFAKALAKLSVAMRGLDARAVFVSWKAEAQEGKAFKEQNEKMEKVSGMMMMFG